jgi:hypothetical protein
VDNFCNRFFPSESITMKWTILPLLLLFLGAGYSSFAQNVGISTDGSSPDSSAMLDVKSTSKGMLIPRMSQEQRLGIFNPAKGLLVFQTDEDEGFYYNQGTASSPNWQLLGAPQPLTGDVTTSTSSVATIANSAITTPKIADKAVTMDKLGTTSGTASSTTFLRGDGVWAPSVTPDYFNLLEAVNTVEQEIPMSVQDSPLTSLTFNQYGYTTIGSFDGTTFTPNAPGKYLITVSTVSIAPPSHVSGNVAIRPGISINGSVICWGVGNYSENYRDIYATGSVTTVCSLTTFDSVRIKGLTSAYLSAKLSTNGTSRLTITKLP